MLLSLNNKCGDAIHAYLPVETLIEEAGRRARSPSWVNCEIFKLLVGDGE